MAWKETDLLADLASVYLAVDPVPTIVEVEDSKGVTWKQVNVLEVGKSEKDQKQIGHRKNIGYYIYHAGLGDEVAYYMINQPVNDVNKAVSTITNDLYSYEKIFSSVELRKRILGWILKAIAQVAEENPGTSDHSMRFKWACDAMHDPQKYLNTCMWYIAQSDDVRILGNAAADLDLTWLAFMITNIAASWGFTN